MQVEGLTVKEVGSREECTREMEYGVARRSVASTEMNAVSSRSHAICQLHVTTTDAATEAAATATISLVDLAGSERLRLTEVTMQELMAISLGLSTLRRVIDALVAISRGKRVIPPHRESTLTWLMRDALGGSCKTFMLATVSPHLADLDDTISTLRYGLKAKAVVCSPVRQVVSAVKHAAEAGAATAGDSEQRGAAGVGGSAFASACGE